MSAPVLAEKRCSSCGVVKPLSRFSVGRAFPDGRQYRCKDCDRARVRERQAARRAKMGEEAWLAHQREIVARSRERRGMASERLWGRARSRAVSALIEAHRSEYEELLRRSKYEHGIA